LRVALVHLVRKQNPPEAFARFWKSYVDHPPGMDHDLIIVWKNFIGVDHPNVPGEVNVRHFVVSDQGCDIDIYFKVSKMFDYDAFVFLNSWSEIIKDGWLKTMHNAMRDEVGLVGAFFFIVQSSHEFLQRAWERMDAGPFMGKGSVAGLCLLSMAQARDPYSCVSEFFMFEQMGL